MKHLKTRVAIVFKVFQSTEMKRALEKCVLVLNKLKTYHARKVKE